MQQSNQTSTRTYSFQAASVQTADGPSSSVLSPKLGLSSGQLHSVSHSLSTPLVFPLALDRHIRLPNNLHSFLLYLSGLSLICAGMILHVLLSAQILQAEVRLGQLEQEHSLLEQENGEVLWQLARETNLARLQKRIDALGYVPSDQREYVIQPASALEASMATTSTKERSRSRGGIASFAPSLAILDTSPPLLQRLQIWKDSLANDVVTEQQSGSDYAAANEAQGGALWTNEQRQKWWQHVWQQTLERGLRSLHLVSDR